MKHYGLLNKRCARAAESLPAELQQNGFYSASALNPGTPAIIYCRSLLILPFHPKNKEIIIIA